MATPGIDASRVYGVQRQARGRLFDWVRPLTLAQYTRPFPFGLATLRATLLEIARVEFYLTARLAETPLPPVVEWPFTEAQLPAFADLETAWRPRMDRTQAVLAETADWDRTVTSEIRWPDRTVVLTATKADIAAQLLLHDVHHRAQAMAILRQLGVPAETLDYIGFVQQRTVRAEPGRDGHGAR